MTKHNKSDKIVSIRIPTILLDKFKELCEENYQTMSSVMRDLINEYVKKENDGKKIPS